MNNTQFTQMADEFSAFKDQFGMISINPDENTDNGALFTAESLICMLSNIDQNTGPQKAVFDSYIKILNTLNDESGFMARQPGSKAYNSMDNYTARLSLNIIGNELMSGVSNGVRLQGYDLFANNLLELNMLAWDGVDTNYSDSAQVKLSQDTRELAAIIGGNFRFPKYCYNNNDNYKFCFYSWFGRSPALVGLIQIAATGKTNWFNATCLFVSQMMGAYTDISDLDARKLAYVAWQALKKRNKIWALGYKIWCNKLLKDYPNGMQDVYKNYFRNSNHPLIKYSKSFIP